MGRIKPHYNSLVSLKTFNLHSVEAWELKTNINLNFIYYENFFN